MFTPIHQRARTTSLLDRLICRSFLLLLTLLVLTYPLTAQTEQEIKQAAAQKLLTEGLQLFKQGTKDSLQAALSKYTEALPLLISLGDQSNEAIVQAAIGEIYNLLGDKQQALKYHAQALTLRRTAGDHRGVVRTLTQIGDIYKDLGEKQEALNQYAQALALARSVRDQVGEATVLNNTGKAYYDWGEAPKALDQYEKARAVFHTLKDNSSEAVTLNNIGMVYGDRGEIQKAFDYYAQALALARIAKDIRNEAVTLNNIGALYSGLGDREKALTYLRQALTLRHKAGDFAGAAQTLNNIGATLNYLDESQSAIDGFTQALELKHALGDRVGEAMVLSNIGTVYYNWGKYEEALKYYGQALALRRVIQDPIGTVTTLNNIGTVFGHTGEKAEAANYLTLALKLCRVIGDRQSEAEVLLNLAYLDFIQGNLSEALVKSESALDIIESVRTKSASQELRASYFATKHSVYDFYIELLMRLHKQQPTAGYDGKALQASERARARSLLDMLAEAGLDIRQGVNPHVVERERLLRQQLNASAQKRIQLLSGKFSKEAAEASAKELESLTTELQQLEAQIRQTSPGYAALTQPVPLTLREIQTQALDADTLLLEYSLGPERSYLWVVTTTSIKSYELPGQTEIERAAKQFYELLNMPIRIYVSAEQQGTIGLATLDAQQQEMLDTASHLSQMLLGPAAAQLGQKRLVIVADGALQYLPFAALPDPIPNTRDGKVKQPLIVQHEIDSLPSISVVMTLRNELAGRQPASKVLAVLADPVFYADDERVRKKPVQSGTNRPTPPVDVNSFKVDVERVAQETQARRDGDRLARLKATRKEAQAILALVSPAGAKSALDFDASRELASSGELRQYRYVHFATHGLVDSIHPELSAIVLSLVDVNGNPQDGFLRAHEVYNLNLLADVVVLSGCKTGLGKDVKGEGLIGLTRGFMYAGAERVVVSLWNVDDEATAELMGRFYKGMLNEGKTPAGALREAQVDMLKQPRWQAPYYWAAFVLQGEWK